MTPTLEQKITEAIRAAYPESIWRRVPEEIRAKDAVMAQALRDMAPAMASIAVQVIDSNFIPRADVQTVVEKIGEFVYVLNPTDEAYSNGYLNGLSKALSLIQKLLKPETSETQTPQ